MLFGSVSKAQARLKCADSPEFLPFEWMKPNLLLSHDTLGGGGSPCPSFPVLKSHCDKLVRTLVSV